MPTPVGHSLAGLAITLAAGERRERRSWLAGASLILLANLPDFDFLPGYLIGNPRAYHWGPAHSLVAALLAGAGCGLFTGRSGRSFWRFFLLGGTAYSSHLLLDMLLGPGAKSVGLQVFWPLSSDRYSAPWSVFLTLPHSLDHVGPLRALFSPAVLPLMLRELAIMGPVCLGAWLLGRQTSPAAGSASRLPPLTAENAADCDSP